MWHKGTSVYISYCQLQQVTGHTPICYIAISNIQQLYISLTVMWHKRTTVYISYCQLQQDTQPHCDMLYSYQQHTAAIYTGCPRRNVRDFMTVFLMLKYTDINQNTYVQSGTFWPEKFETLTAVTHLLITKYILKLSLICGFCNVNCFT